MAEDDAYIMISLKVHSGINLALNCAFLICVIATEFLDFFAFMVSFIQDYKIGMLTITHRLKFEDVAGDVYSTFSNFDAFACPFSQDPGIVTICGNILNFQVAGFVYAFLSDFLILSLIFSILNLLMLLLSEGNWLARLWVPHVVNAGIFIVAGGEFLLVSNVDGLEPPARLQLTISSEAGIPMLFVTAAIGIITLLHYLFLRKYRNLASLEIGSMLLVKKFLSSPGDLGTLSPPEHETQKQVVDLNQQLRASQDQVSELKVELEALHHTVADLRLSKPEKQRQGAGLGDDKIEVAEDVFQSTENAKTLQEIAELNSKIELLTGQLEKAAGEKQEVDNSLAKLTTRLSEEKKHHSGTKKTVQELQARVDQLLQEVANTAGVEQMKKLLEQEKEQELERQKTLFLQQIRTREDEAFDLRNQLESAKRELTRKEDGIREAGNRAETAESRVKALETEAKETREKLKSAETAARDLDALKVRLELDIKRLTSELGLVKEQYKQLDEMHKKALIDMGQGRSDQLENLKKMYEENNRREAKALEDSYGAREKRLQTDLTRAQKELAQAQDAVSKLDQEGKNRQKVLVEAEAELKRLRTQVENLTARLVHAESEASKATETASEASRRAQELGDELSSLQTKLKSQEILTSKMLSEQENRHESEKDRLKALYEEMQKKEMNEIKLFYDQKLGKLTADLVSERSDRANALDAAERASRDKETAENDLKRLNDLYLKQKQLADTLQTSQMDKEAGLQAQIQERDVIILQLKSENEGVQTGRKSTEDIEKLQHELNSLRLQDASKEDEIRELTKTINALGSQNSAEVNTELERLRDSLRKKEDENRTLEEQALSHREEIKRISDQVASLTAKIAEYESLLPTQRSTSADLKLKERKLQHKREKLHNARDQITALNEEKKKQLADLQDTYRGEMERLKEIYARSFQGQTEDVKKMYEGIVANLKSERDKLREDAESQSSKLTESQVLYNRLRKEFELLESERDSEVEIRQKINKQYSELKSRYEDAQNQIDDKNRLLDSLRKSSGSKETIELLESQIRDLNSTKGQLAKDLDLAQKERDDLRQELKLKEGELQGVKEEYMQVHKELFQNRETPRPTGGWSRDSKSQESAHSVKETMVIEGMTVLSGPNPILEKISSLRRESPMTYSNVWKLFESLMQEKVKLDRLEMSMGRQPRSMIDFMLDFVYMHYGLKTLALKQLKALVMSLQDLYKTNHAYGVLFARFIGLFHPRPLPTHLAVYLLVAQEEFEKAAARIKVKRSESFAEQYDVLQYGGQASIIDAMELVVRLCKNNREAGERIIGQLLPAEDENRVKLTLMKVCGTMSRMGKDPSYIFEILDRDKGGFIDYHEFVDGIRLTLNIWVTQDEAEDLCGFINDRGTGDVTYEEWARKVDFLEYTEKVNSKEAMVTKSALLNALIEEYEFEVVQDYYTLRNLIKKPVVDEATAMDLLWRVDPTLDESKTAQLFEEAKQFDKDSRGGVTPEAFCIVILRNRIGGFGVGIFGKRLCRHWSGGTDGPESAGNAGVGVPQRKQRKRI